MRELSEIEKINNMCACKKNEPIYDKRQMDKKLTWDKIDESWLSFVKNKFWCTKFKGSLLGSVSSAFNTLEEGAEHIKLILKLRDKLLTFGGEQACMPNVEEDLHNILNRGQFWYGDRIKIMKGEDRRCHRNSSELWWNNKDKLCIATGYALSEDGMWRQHTWCINVRPRVNQIIETTEKRIAYFGFVITYKEAMKFESEHS